MCSSETLIELCEREFETFVADLFAKNRARWEKLCAAPFIDTIYSTRDDEYAAEIKRKVHAALAARKAFREHGPSWAPLLPLTSADIYVLHRYSTAADRLVAHYAWSQLQSDWDRRHPTFDPYAGGVMAHVFKPDYLQNDALLWIEFPPVPLPGIDRSMCWNSPERLAERREAARRDIEFWSSRLSPEDLQDLHSNQLVEALSIS